MEESTSLVCPATRRFKANSLRIGCTTLAALGLAATVCVVFSYSQNEGTVRLAQVAALSFGHASFHADVPPQSKEGSVRKGVVPDFVPPLGNLGEVGLKGAKPQALAISPKKALASLAFGDSSFHADVPATSKEGSVRKGVRPDFVPPLGTLGEVGLKSTVKPQALAITPRKSEPKLAFGDFSIHDDISPSAKEGSIRKGIKPDFVPPLGTLGETGLKTAAAPQALAIAKPKMSLPRLAFGDAVFQPEKKSPASREGSVRQGVKPDFAPPIGDLGEVGLVRKPPIALHAQTLAIKPLYASAPKVPSVPVEKAAAKPALQTPLHSSALAFGDATFVPSQSSTLAREGSVRGAIRPDFKPPIGDLGEVGLKTAVKAQTLAASKSRAAASKPDAAAHGAKMSDESSRAALDSFYAQELRSAKPSKSAAPDAAGHLSDAKARAGLEAFYESKAKEDAEAKQPAHPAASAAMSDVSARKGLEAFFGGKAAARREEAAAEAKAKPAAESAKTALEGIRSYYAGKTAEDKSEQLKAVAAAAAEEKAERGAAYKYFTAQARTAAAALAAAHKAKAASSPAAAVKPPPALAKAAAAVVKAAAKAPAKAEAKPVAKTSGAQALAYLPMSVFDSHEEGNRHGFHSGHVSFGAARKALDRAGAIAKKDLDDCGFTLC